MPSSSSICLDLIYLVSKEKSGFFFSYLGNGQSLLSSTATSWFLVMVDFLYHKYHLLVKINERKKKKSEKKKKNIIKRWKKGILAFPRLFAWLSSPQFDLVINLSLAFVVRSSFAMSSLALFWGGCWDWIPPFCVCPMHFNCLDEAA